MKSAILMKLDALKGLLGSGEKPANEFAYSRQSASARASARGESSVSRSVARTLGVDSFSELEPPQAGATSATVRSSTHSRTHLPVMEILSTSIV
jgi:hypothetical protein